MHQIDNLHNGNLPLPSRKVILYSLWLLTSRKFQFPIQNPYNLAKNVPKDPAKAMYMYTDPPIRYAISVNLAYFEGSGNSRSTGMKNVWIENAPPIEAARLTPPTPNSGIRLGPEGAVLISQTKNTQYPIILTIPYPNNLAPKWK